MLQPGESSSHFPYPLVTPPWIHILHTLCKHKKERPRKRGLSFYLLRACGGSLDRAGGGDGDGKVSRRHRRANRGQDTGRSVDGVGRDVAGVEIRYVSELAGRVHRDKWGPAPAGTAGRIGVSAPLLALVATTVKVAAVPATTLWSVGWAVMAAIGGDDGRAGILLSPSHPASAARTSSMETPVKRSWLFMICPWLCK